MYIFALLSENVCRTLFCDFLCYNSGDEKIMEGGKKNSEIDLMGSRRVKTDVCGGSGCEIKHAS